MVGNVVAGMLRGKGHSVDGFDCLKPYNEWQAEFARTDKMSDDKDLIVHIGAVVDPNVASIDNESELWEMNYCATKLLGEYAQAIGAKMLFFSSYAAKDPTTPYGWSKRVAEDILKATLPEQDLCIFRPLVIWDYHEAGKRGPSIVYRILSETLDFVYENCVRDCVHVSDVARAVGQIIGDWQSGTYEIGLGKEIEIDYLVREIYDRLPTSFSKPEVVPSPLACNYAVAEHRLQPPNWKPVCPPVLDMTSQLAAYMVNNR